MPVRTRRFHVHEPCRLPSAQQIHLRPNLKTSRRMWASRVGFASTYMAGVRIDVWPAILAITFDAALGQARDQRPQPAVRGRPVMPASR